MKDYISIDDSLSKVKKNYKKDKFIVNYFVKKGLMFIKYASGRLDIKVYSKELEENILKKMEEQYYNAKEHSLDIVLKNEVKKIQKKYFGNIGLFSLFSNFIILFTFISLLGFTMVNASSIVFIISTLGL